MKSFDTACHVGALVALAAFAAMSSTAWAAAPSYSVRPVHEEGTVQSGEGLNNRGGVLLDVVSQGGANYRCNKSECMPIPSLPNDLNLPWAYPTSINDHGTVAGTSYVGAVTHAVLFDGQTVKDLGAFPEDGCGGCSLNSEASAINGKGDVVGYSNTADHTSQAFVWRNGTMTKLPTLGGATSGAKDINDAGDIVGFASLANGERHAVVYRAGQVQDLGTLRLGKYSTAFAINGAGQVVGDSDTGQSKPLRVAFIHDPTSGMREIPLLKGWQQMTAFSINDSGWVVGQGVAFRGQAGFVFDGQSSHDLDQTLSEADRKHWRILRARDINEKGQILVEAQSKKSGGIRVLLLTPR